MAALVGIVVLIVVLGGPVVLMVLLVYHGEKSRRAERDASRFCRRGFEVKQDTGTTPVLREKENDHG